MITTVQGENIFQILSFQNTLAIQNSFQRPKWHIGVSSQGHSSQGYTSSYKYVTHENGSYLSHYFPRLPRLKNHTFRLENKSLSVFT